MRAPIALLLSLTVSAAASAASPPPHVAVDLELVLAVDVSGSIDEAEGELQRQGYIAAITDPGVLAAIQSGVLRRIAVAYFEWAGDFYQTPVVDWTVIDGPESAAAFAAKLRAAPVSTGPWTSISGAIDYAAPMFTTNAIEGTRRVIDISGDGPNNSGPPVPASRDAAVARGITINGLPIMNNRSNFGRRPMPNLDLYYDNCVIGGRGAFIVVAESFKNFAQAIRRKLMLEIAGQPGGDGAVRAAGWAQAGRATPRERWVPPCDAGERRFRRRDDDW